MRSCIIFTALSVSVALHAQQNCTGIALDVDARCGCVKDPNSQVCALVKQGFYDHPVEIKPPGSGWTALQQDLKASPQKAQPARQQAAQPRQARVVPLNHSDYLRFLQPNATMAAGFDLSKLTEAPQMVDMILGASHGDARLAAGLKEMDHMWMSIAGSTDVVVLMTGKFEQGALAGLFYAQGVYPVFLGGAHAMMIGPEPSIQAALARLNAPAPSAKSSSIEGWVARRAREFSKDHETWIVTEPPSAPEASDNSPPVRRFALGVRLAGEGSIDGEAVSDSESGSAAIAAWIEQMKTAVRQRTGVGVLDPLTVTRDGATVRFAAAGDKFLAGDAGKTTLDSDFGVELYSLIMSGFPGAPARLAAEDKLLSVKAGMKREEILGLLGPPLAITTIQGLATPRETWTYQIPSGKQMSLRLDGGVATGPAR